MGQGHYESPKPKQAAQPHPGFFLWLTKEFFLSRYTSCKIYIKGIRQPKPALTSRKGQICQLYPRENLFGELNSGSESRNSFLAVPLRCHWNLILPVRGSQVLFVKQDLAPSVWRRYKLWSQWGNLNMQWSREVVLLKVATKSKFWRNMWKDASL